MKIDPILEQRSEAWFLARAGRPTASNFKRLITDNTEKDASLAAWTEYGYELCSSIINPQEVTFEGNFHTDRGVALEPLARAAFEKAMNCTVHEVGFCTTDDGLLGCSPDGLVSFAGQPIFSGVEIKSPIGKKHARYIVENKLPDEYKAQVHGSMIVTGLRSWYFVSYNVDYSIFIVKVDWNEYTDKLQACLQRFLDWFEDFSAKTMPILIANRKEAA